MDVGGGKKDVVDPEVRAYVSSLVTAVSRPSSPRARDIHAC
jgi:replication fork protection complex subunit Tof1/Swi1